MQVDPRGFARLDIGSVFESDISLAIQIDAHNAGSARIRLVNPADSLLHPGLHRPMVNKHQATKQENAVVPFDPGSDLVGMQDDGAEVSRDVARKPEWFIRSQDERPGNAPQSEKRNQ